MVMSASSAALIANVGPGIAVNLASFTFPKTFDKMQAADGEVKVSNLLWIIAPMFIGAVVSLAVAYAYDKKYSV